MTTLSSQPIADAQQAFTSLRRLSLCVLLVSLPFGVLVLGLPLIAHEMGASALVIGGLLSIYALILVITQPVVGYGVDRFGRRSFLIEGLLGYALSNAIFGLASDITGLFLAQLAQGTGAGLLWLAALAAVYDLAPDDSLGREYGRLEEMSIRGALIGALAGFALLRLLSRSGVAYPAGWRMLFLGFSAAALLAAGIAWWGIPESLQPDEKSTGRGDPAVPVDKKWLPSRQLGIVLGIAVLTAGAIEIISPILVQYLGENVSTSLPAIALAFLPAALAGTVLPSRLGGMSDRYGRRPVLSGALLVGGLATLVVPFVRSLWPLALLWVFEAAAFAAAIPAAEGLVVDIAGGERPGMALGFYTAAIGLGGVFGPLLGGWLSDHFAPGWVFATGAVLMALGAGLVLLGVREPAGE
jgi:MFS transporter, DHA1 family, multidrug resistance protein